MHSRFNLLLTKLLRHNWVLSSEDFSTPMPTKHPRISFLADEELRQKLERMADEQHRTLSNMVYAICQDAAKQWEEQKQKTSASEDKGQ